MRLGDLHVTHHFSTVHGLRMHYVSKGEGPLVVLLHGFPENWWCWRYQIDALVRAGYRVVAPDQRGYNDTEARGPYDFETLATDIRELILSLGETRATIIAHDLGGLVAWQLLSMDPSICQRLVTINIPHPALMERALRTSRAQIKRSWYVGLFQLPFIPERFLTRNGAEAIARSYREHSIDHTHFGDEEIQPFLDGILKPGKVESMLGWYRAAARDALHHLRTPRVFAPVECPTLIVWGMLDRALGFDDLVPGTEQYAPRLDVHKIEGAGHFVQQEQPDAVNRVLLAWLARTKS